MGHFWDAPCSGGTNMPTSPSEHKKKVSKKPPSSVTVYKGVYERGIGTANPYFQVRIRHRGSKEESERFPYLPVGAFKGRTKAEVVEQGMKREKALQDAIVAAAKDKSHFHFYGKPKAQLAKEHALRDWIEDWVKEACELTDAKTGQPIEDLPVRKGATEDGKQVLRLVRIADAYATKHNRASVMDRPVTELQRRDITGPHGLLKMLTGRAKKGEETKPPATPATQRRALALLGMVWNHARDHWDMDIPRPWKDVVIRGVEKGESPRGLNVDEYNRVEEALAEVSPVTLAAIQFLRWTAARAGEMRKLRWEHITWPTKDNALPWPVVKFVGTKTPVQGAYRERDVPLFDGAREALLDLYDPKDQKGKRQGLPPPAFGIVFKAPHSPDQPLSRDTAYQAFVRAVRRANVPHARLHDLRHTRTSELGGDMEQAQAMVITGHTDVRTFMRYTHLNEGSYAKIAAGDAKRRRAKDGEDPESKRSVIDQLKDLDLTPEERMLAIAALAGK